MKLIASTTSPFVRKVLVTAHELGLTLDVDYLVTTVLAPNPTLGEVHPLFKLPTLITDDAIALYDSRVIVEYLQSLVPASRLCPPAGTERFLVLRTQALADGILDAAVLVFYETMFREPAQRSERWLAAQADKAQRGLAELERSMDGWALGTAAGFDLGQIAVACTLGWLAFREPLPSVRTAYPALYAWFDETEKRSSMKATVPRLPSS